MLDALQEGGISRSQARTLLAEDDMKKRHEMFESMLRGEMTVAQAEAKVQVGSKRRKTMKAKDPNIAALEDELRSALGTKVGIQMTGGNGKVTIHFYSKEELKALIKKLTD